MMVKRDESLEDQILTAHDPDSRLPYWTCWRNQTGTAVLGVGDSLEESLVVLYQEMATQAMQHYGGRRIRSA